MTWDPNPPAQPPTPDEPTGETPVADAAPTVEHPAADSPPTVEHTAAWPPPPPPPNAPPPPLPGANPAWPSTPTGGHLPPASPQPRPAPVYGAGGLPPGPPAGGPWSSAGAPTPPPATPAAAPSRPRHTALKVVGATVFAAALVGSGFGVRALTEDQGATTIVRSPSSVSTVPDVTVDPKVEPLAAVASAVGPSVVQIETPNGLGSGVVYDDQGHVLTNAHVVGTATSVTVRTADGTAVQGRVLGTDTGTDIAVVRVDDSSGLPAAALATTAPVVGQTAVAVGSPFGLEQTITAGIVSAVNRPVDNDKGVVVNMIQTDAAINPGNSGGALANRNGQVVGINTAIFSQSGENNGIGFAIPIATASRSADKIISGESTAKAGLGLTGPSETPSGDAGAYVQSLVQGGAAEAAGIKTGDLIVAVDGTPVRSFEQLRGLISSYSPGDQVTVTVERDGGTVDVQVTLGTLTSSSSGGR